MLKHYKVDPVKFRYSKDSLNIAWATLGWFSISVSFTIFNKWLMQLWMGGFDYPILMTTLHMAIKVLISRVWICFRNEPVPSLSWAQTLKLVIPIGIFTASDIMLSNLSILYIPLSLYTALKTTVPVWTFVMGIIMGVERFEIWTFLSISFVVCGLAIAVQFSVEGSWTGVIYVLLASLSGGLRWLLLQVLVGSDQDSREIMVAIYRFSPSSTLFLLPIGLYVELPRLLGSKFCTDINLGLTALGNACSGGFFSIALIAFEIYILRKTSSVTLGILGQIKEVFQILLSVLIYSEYLTVQTIIGLTVSVIAANFYRRIKQAQSRLEQTQVLGSEDGYALPGSRLDTEIEAEMELDVFKFTGDSDEEDTDLLLIM